MKKVYTIPPGTSFVDELAKGLLEQVDGDPLKLADMLIFLPTRRSCRALSEAFLRQMKVNSALLPRMQPLGDIDEEELAFTESHVFDVDIPPALPPLRRQLLLTHLIAAKDKDMPLDQAAQLAKALGSFLDEVHRERCDMARLEGLVVEKDLAEHWRQTVAFLEILTKTWPAVLNDEGGIDHGARQNLLSEAQSATWRANPPAFPVIVAGTTGSIPAISDLLDTVAELPEGTVILPGLDTNLPEEAWQEIDETHPQFGMKKLLERFGVERKQVKIWDAPHPNKDRVRLLQTSMQPPATTGSWGDLKAGDISVHALKGLAHVEFDHPQEEAQAIALMMRGALEVPGKTATLVTPDRDLAARVLALLKRWGIEANDSAGNSLASLPAGAFLTGILDAASPQTGPIDILSLLKHPLAACGIDPAECRAHAREVEMKIFRQEKPARNKWLDTFLKTLSPLTKDWNKILPMAERIALHIRLGEEVAASADESGAERLWRGEGGEAAAEWLDEWRKAASGFPPLTGEDYRSLFLELMGAVRVRPRYGQHPRLNILGPLEARLIQADLTILGGLNEGTWPPQASIDPWMSRPMRKAFGLSSPERRIGLSAHDFVQLASSPEVVLTRAKRAGNAPTVPSRFLLQLEAVLEALGYTYAGKDALAPAQPWAAWARTIDRPEKIVPILPPEPRPSEDARPRKLPVTEIGTWRRNPYAIYAKHILGLRKLDPLEPDIDASDRGMMIHDALETFMKEYGNNWPADALEKLLAIGRKCFAVEESHPEVRAFWWPRFERVASWFIETECARHVEGKKLLMAEARGEIALKSFILTGRADRIDALPEGGIEIVDYKTGSVPTQKAIDAGYEPQLPLLALIAAEGGFKGIKSAEVKALSYWKLHGGRKAAEAIPVKGAPDQMAEKAKTGLLQLIEKFIDPATPYQAVPKPRQAPRYDDYAHLARLSEWGRTGNDE